jgi:hypothetical protein
MNNISSIHTNNYYLLTKELKFLTLGTGNLRPE